MIDSVPRPDAGLPEFLAARARHASDSRLAVDALAGLLVAGAAAYWGGPGSPFLASIAICFFAFGVWGIADRELGERPAAGPRLRLSLVTLRVAAAILGFAAAAYVAVLALAKALGVMIS